RDGISTNGARPRSAAWTTSSASPRIDPSVFLSFAVSVTLSNALLVFFAILLIHDQNILAKIFHFRFDLQSPGIETRVRFSGFTLGHMQQTSIEILLRPLAKVFY